MCKNTCNLPLLNGRFSDYQPGGFFFRHGVIMGTWTNDSLPVVPVSGVMKTCFISDGYLCLQA